MELRKFVTPEILHGAGARTVQGLGLFTSRQLTQMQGGDIAVGDTPGGGATVTVSSPAAGLAAPVASGAEEEHP